MIAVVHLCVSMYLSASVFYGVSSHRDDQLHAIWTLVELRIQCFEKFESFMAKSLWFQQPMMNEIKNLVIEKNVTCVSS